MHWRTSATTTVSTSDSFSSASGPLEDELRRAVRACALEERVWMPGPLYEIDLADALGAADILCSSSSYEGFGLTIIEGMACALPVVAHAVGGVTDLVVDGVTGHLMETTEPLRLGPRHRRARVRSRGAPTDGLIRASPRRGAVRDGAPCRSVHHTVRERRRAWQRTIASSVSASSIDGRGRFRDGRPCDGRGEHRTRRPQRRARRRGRCLRPLLRPRRKALATLSVTALAFGLTEAVVLVLIARIAFAMSDRLHHIGAALGPFSISLDDWPVAGGRGRSRRCPRRLPSSQWLAVGRDW